MHDTAAPSATRLLVLTGGAMLAFAANSVLCRLALRHTRIDAASFTAVRLLAGAAMLCLVLGLRGKAARDAGSWASGAALFTYAAAFSFAYAELATGIGALLLFGCVQATMVLQGLLRGERLGRWQLAGMAVAFAGLVALLLPHGAVGAPPPAAAALMALSGVAWGIYSLRGRGAVDPAAMTRGNFLRAAPLGLALLAASWPLLQWDAAGLALALVSGGLTSGLGYILWYSVTPHLRAAQAATVQLSVPLLAAAAGMLLLGESLLPAQWAAGAAIVGGIGLSLRQSAPIALKG